MSVGNMAMAGAGSWLGVQLDDVDAQKMKTLKLASEAGAVVTSVEANSPAAKAGVEKDDVILSFGGERVRSIAQLRRLVRETPPERTVSVEMSRGGRTRTLNIKMEARQGFPAGESLGMGRGPENFNIHVPAISVPEMNFNFDWDAPRLGVEAEPLTSQLGSYFGVKDGKGVLVREVVAGSAAEKSGLKAGDCIVRVDEKEIATVHDLHDAVRAGSTRDHTVTVIRDRHEQSFNVHFPEPSKGQSSSAAGDLFPGRNEIAGLEAQIRQLQPEIERLKREALEQANSKELQEELRRHLEELRRQLEPGGPVI
jgi:membrane-associated protease RseP (regulator of RpoE activity)